MSPRAKKCGARSALGWLCDLPPHKGHDHSNAGDGYYSESTTIEFEIPGPAVGKERALSVFKPGRKTRRITPDRTRAYEARVKEAAWLAMQEAGLSASPFRGPVSLEVLTILDSPRLFVRVKPIRNPSVVAGIPDLSNVVKAVEDAMNGVVYLDDRQVASLSAERRTHLG